MYILVPNVPIMDEHELMYGFQGLTIDIKGGYSCPKWPVDTHQFYSFRESVFVSIFVVYLTPMGIKSSSLLSEWLVNGRI